MFLTRREPGVALVSFPTLSSSLFSSFSSIYFPYPSCSSMSFSLIYICCSFRGGILSVVFATVAICFWPAGNLECPCLFSDLISSLFSSFSSILFLTLPFLLCLFHWSISAVVSGEAVYQLFSPFWPYVSDPQGTWSDLVSFPILSSSLFSSFSSILFLTLPFLLCLFHWSISAVVSREAFYLLFSPL